MELTTTEARIADAIEADYYAIRDIDYAAASAARSLRTTSPVLRRTLRKMVDLGRARFITDGEGFATFAIVANFDAE